MKKCIFIFRRAHEFTEQPAGQTRCGRAEGKLSYNDPELRYIMSYTYLHKYLRGHSFCHIIIKEKKMFKPVLNLVIIIRQLKKTHFILTKTRIFFYI